MQLKKRIRKESKAYRIRRAQDALAFNPNDKAAAQLLEQLTK